MGFFSKFLIKKENLDFLIVGLGNPDKTYLNTRHNIGWMVIDSFIEKYKINIADNKEFKGFFAKYEVNGKSIGFLKPTTYMNRSGIAIERVLQKYDITPENIIIVIDEYNFPVGKIQIKIGGSDGGHNGMTSVLNCLKENNFLRLRCGIDKKFGPGELVDYVLSDFGDDEKENLKQMIENSVISLEYLIRNPQAKAISFINSGKLWKDENKTNNKSDKINN